MNYFQLVGTCRTVGLPTRIRGIGDEPLEPLSDGSILLMHHRSCGKLPRGFKVDQHSSFPQGLPKAFQLTDEHIRG